MLPLSGARRSNTLAGQAPAKSHRYKDEITLQRTDEGWRIILPANFGHELRSDLPRYHTYNRHFALPLTTRRFMMMGLSGEVHVDAVANIVDSRVPGNPCDSQRPGEWYCRCICLDAILLLLCRPGCCDPAGHKARSPEVLWPLWQDGSTEQRYDKSNSEGKSEQDPPNVSSGAFVSEFSRRLLSELPMQGPVRAATCLCDLRVARAGLASSGRSHFLLQFTLRRAVSPSSFLAIHRNHHLILEPR